MKIKNRFWITFLAVVIIGVVFWKYILAVIFLIAGITGAYFLIKYLKTIF